MFPASQPFLAWLLRPSHKKCFPSVTCCLVLGRTLIPKGVYRTREHFGVFGEHETGWYIISHFRVLYYIFFFFLFVCCCCFFVGDLTFIFVFIPYRHIYIEKYSTGISVYLSVYTYIHIYMYILQTYYI